jgi:hypothetical protein
MNPLILRFSNELPPAPLEIIRYDEERQIAQVFQDGAWVDRLLVGGRDGTTRVTCVQAETTDDT